MADDGPPRAIEPREVHDGALLSASRFLLIVPAAKYFESHGQRVSSDVAGRFVFFFLFMQMAGELCLSPVGLAW